MKEADDIQHLTDVDFTGDLELISNTAAKSESILHSLERATGGISFYVNAISKNACVLNKKKRGIFT